MSLIWTGSNGRHRRTPAPFKDELGVAAVMASVSVRANRRGIMRRTLALVIQGVALAIGLVVGWAILYALGQVAEFIAQSIS